MVTAVIENIEEYAILDTVRGHYDSDYNFSIRLVKGVSISEKRFCEYRKWQVMNQFQGIVALYNPKSKILTMLV